MAYIAPSMQWTKSMCKVSFAGEMARNETARDNEPIDAFEPIVP